MKKFFVLFGLIVCGAVVVWAQQDSVVERNVTIEREFRPVIQDAGKVATSPSVFVPTIKSQDISYTDFTKPLTIGTSFHALDKAVVQFTLPAKQKGFLRLGGGVWNSLGDFTYDVLNSKRSNLGVMFNHSGLWGKKRVSGTNAALDYNTVLKKVDLYAGVIANHTYFNYYGRAYDASSDGYTWNDVAVKDVANMWNVRTKLGVRSLPGAKVNYKVQTGYEMFVGVDKTMESQVHTIGMLDWGFRSHAVGLDFEMQNLFYDVNAGVLDVVPNTLLHIAPYYAWRGEKFQATVGVNLDFATAATRIFGMSPNVKLNWGISDRVSLYGVATGSYNSHTLQSAFGENRYIDPLLLFAKDMSSYKPLDASVGVKVRPHANLMMNLYGGYELAKDQYFYEYNEYAGRFDVLHDDMQRVKAGIDVHYHYKDMVNVTAGFMYNWWDAAVQTKVYDRAAWEADLGVQVKLIDRLYLQAETFFAGKRYALVRQHDGMSRVEELKPIIDLNIGATYQFSELFSAFASFNNLINRKHDAYYAYQVQGFNFLVGVTLGF